MLASVLSVGSLSFLKMFSNLAFTNSAQSADPAEDHLPRRCAHVPSFLRWTVGCSLPPSERCLWGMHVWPEVQELTWLWTLAGYLSSPI